MYFIVLSAVFKALTSAPKRDLQSFEMVDKIC